MGRERHADFMCMEQKNKLLKHVENKLLFFYHSDCLDSTPPPPHHLLLHGGLGPDTTGQPECVCRPPSTTPEEGEGGGEEEKEEEINFHLINKIKFHLLINKLSFTSSLTRKKGSHLR